MTFERRFTQVTLNNPPDQRRDVVAVMASTVFQGTPRRLPTSGVCPR